MRKKMHQVNGNTKHSGFTLIEVLIVVVIIGILSAIAIPSYKSSVVKTHRSDAMGDLQGLAQAMERHFLANQTYTTAVDGAKKPLVYSDVSPVEGTAHYNLTVEAVTATSYTLRATPIAGTIVDGDGNLELDSLGQRTWKGNPGWR